MDFMEKFQKIRSQFINADVSSIKEHLAYQFNVIGEYDGIFYAEVKDGVLHIEPYDYHDRDVIFTATWKVLEEILSGERDPVGAVLTGKFQVKGSMEKAMLLKEMLQ